MNQPMLIVTYIEFWRPGAGHISRLAAFINFFRHHMSVTVLFLGPLKEDDVTVQGRIFPQVTVDYLDETKRLSFGEYRYKFEDYMRGKNFKVVVVEFIELSFILPYLSPDSCSILDTHDLVSSRIRSFEAFGVPYKGIVLSPQEEIAIYNCFDIVLAIQECDYSTLTSVLGPMRAVLAPHPVAVQKRTNRAFVTNIGFIASGYQPNVEGLVWFLSLVWPFFESQQLVLHIFGNVCNAIPPEEQSKFKNTQFHGFVEEITMAYELCDIMINPVRCGAGLKIKSVEALSFGLPLVTTSHGASGLNTKLSFLIADTPHEFVRCIESLVVNYHERETLSINATNYTANNLTHDKCFGPLLSALKTWIDVT